MNRKAFQQQGFAVQRVFPPDLVRDARADIAEHIDRISRALYLPYAQSWPNEPLETRLDRIWEHDRSQANLLRIAICTDAHRGPRLQKLASSSTLAAAAQSLTGVRLTEENVVRVRAGIASFPDSLHPWHSDVAHDDGTSCSRVCVTAWIPLSDTGPETGGLEIAAGKRNAPLPHEQGRGFAIDARQLAGDRLAKPDCPVGSALFLDRFTPHRSLPVTGDARFALVIWMKSCAT